MLPMPSISRELTAVKFLLIFNMLFVCEISLFANEIQKQNESSNSLSAENLQKRDASVKAAYAKEYAFLLSEKDSMMKRIQNVEKSHFVSRGKLNDEIKNYELKLLKIQADTRLLTKQNADLDAASNDIRSGLQNLKNIKRAALDGVLADVSFTKQQQEKVEEEKVETNSLLNDVGFVFKNALIKVSDRSGVFSESGNFYNLDGVLVSGEIHRVGGFLAYGMHQAETFQLVPGEDGFLKAIASMDRSQKSRGIVNGFLFEGKKAVAAKEEKKITDTLKAGGTIGYVILMLGLTALILLVVRSVMLYRSSTGSQGVTLAAEKSILSGNIEDAKKKVERAKGPLGQVLRTTVDHLGKDKELLETTMSETILEESSKLDRFSTIIVVTAAVAPLLGLLGTVTGMIATFDIITEVGTGDPKMLSGGISEALVTTMFGLIVAIPTLFFGQLTTKWADKIKDMFEHGTLSLVAAYETYKSSQNPQ